MTAPTHLSPGQSGIRWLWIAALIIALDQLSKLWIVNNLELGQSISLLPVFDIFRTFNEGAAWSMFANAVGAQRWIFSSLAIVVSIALVIYLRRKVLATQYLLAFGLTLIVGGALGNLIDRMRLGHVIDFFLAHWGESRFPVFNVADSAISVGAALVVLDALFESRRERLAATAPKQASKQVE